MFKESQERCRIAQGVPLDFVEFHVSQGFRGVPEMFHAASGEFQERSRVFQGIHESFSGLSEVFRWL